MYYRLECNRFTNQSVNTIRENVVYKTLFPVFERMAYYSIKGNIPIDTMIQANNQFVALGDIFFNQIPEEDSNGLIDSSFCVPDTNHNNQLINKIELLRFLSFVLDNGLVYIEAVNVGLVWEYIFELSRQYVDKKLPSRLDSYFLFDSLDSSKYFSQQHRQGLGEIYLVNIVHQICAMSFDMNWLDSIPLSATFGDALKTAIRYWKQEKTDRPIMEVLFQGEYKLGHRIMP